MGMISMMVKADQPFLGDVQKAKLVECLTTSDYHMRTEDYKSQVKKYPGARLLVTKMN